MDKSADSPIHYAANLLPELVELTGDRTGDLVNAIHFPMTMAGISIAPRDEGLQAPLPAHEIEAVLPVPAAHGDRLLEADLRDVLDDLGGTSSCCGSAS